MIILFTRHNEASLNIANMLIAKHGFAKAEPGTRNTEPETQGLDQLAGSPAQAAECWEREGVRLIGTEAASVLDIPTDFCTDCIIVLSSHKSKTPGKMLTAHVPGNWGDAGMGGEPRTLNIAHGLMLKRLIRNLDEANRRRNLGWPVSLEADHHGPTCDVPILFVEIGNGEDEWKDSLAAEVVADAVADAVFCKTQGPEPETVLGVGGGHYQRAFTKMLIETDIAIGHMAPKYAIDSMDDGVFMQAVLKNVGQVKKVLILKDETNSTQKEKVKALAEKAGLFVELV